MDIDNTENNKESAKSVADKKKTANTLIRIARIITFVAAAFLIVMLISEGSVQGITTSDTSGILLLILALIAIAGYVLSLWRIKYAGILLVAVSAAFGIHIGYYLSSSQFPAWCMMGLPHLISGGLLLWAWKLKTTAK